MRPTTTIMAPNAFADGLLAACDRAPRAIEQYDRIEYDGNEYAGLPVNRDYCIKCRIEPAPCGS